MEIYRIAILPLNVQFFFLKELACINTCVVASVSIRSSFKPELIFFSLHTEYCCQICPSSERFSVNNHICVLNTVINLVKSHLTKPN